MHLAFGMAEAHTLPVHSDKKVKPSTQQDDFVIDCAFVQSDGLKKPSALQYVRANQARTFSLCCCNSSSSSVIRVGGEGGDGAVGPSCLCLHHVYSSNGVAFLSCLFVLFVVRSDDVWVITLRTGPVVGRVPLLDGDGKLLPKPRAIFEQWFLDFQVQCSSVQYSAVLCKQCSVVLLLVCGHGALKTLQSLAYFSTEKAFPRSIETASTFCVDHARPSSSCMTDG